MINQVHVRVPISDIFAKVIGHRGSGMNKKASRLQVGENTVLSFITAASLGAEYVEFGKLILIPIIEGTSYLDYLQMYN